MALTLTTSIAKLQSFNIVAVDTATDCVVTCGMEDVSIQHLNLQTDSATAPTASVAGDFIVVTDTNDSTTPTDDFDPGTALGSKSHKLCILAGGKAIFRGYDMVSANSAVTPTRQFTIRAVGHTALVQLVRGSAWGNTP